MPQHIFEKLETYKDLFDHAHDLIHIVNPLGEILYVNNAWKNNLGYRLEEIQGHSIYSVVRPEDRVRFKEYRALVLRGGPPQTVIIIGLVAKNGNIVYVEGFVSAKVVDGQPIYTRGIFRDVTRRLKDEAELRELHAQLTEREANLQQLFFYAPDAIVVIDTESIIRYWNPKAQEIFGWSTEEVLGKSLSEKIIPVQHREAHAIGMKRYITTGETRVLNRTIEIMALDKSGREFYVALTISATYQDGKLAFIAFIRDIDEQKRAARELEQKKAELELSNQQLEQFAHVASHDMKEPIRKILTFTDLLQSDIAPVASERSKNYFEKIESAASRLAQMVDGVLRNSSLQSEGLKLERVNLEGVINNIQCDLELVIREKGAVIEYSSLPVIQGSQFLLYQLFYNLINNSLKFSRSGVTPLIELTARPVPPDVIEERTVNPRVSYAEIVLRDNGIGFAQKYAQSIFKTFSRLHSRDKYEGTGMGLSLCKSIIEKHHGYIYAFGKENEGATFKIYLPETQRFE
jgi:two-component system sensor kinase FixL